MAINLSDNIKVSAPKPVESKYLNITVPYTGTTQVNSCIASGERYRGLTVNINGSEYWYKNDIADSCLIQKQSLGTVTGATNLGSGNGSIFTSVSNGNIQLKSLSGGTNINITCNGNYINISSLAGSSSASGENVTKKITKIGHGFAVKDVIGFSGTTYTKAIANGSYDGEVIGVVSKCIDANNFELTQAGYVTGFTGLVTNNTYFLSDVTAGLMTTTKPSISGHIVKTVMVADTTTSGWVLPYAPFLLSTTSSGSTSPAYRSEYTITGTGTATGFTVNHNTNEQFVHVEIVRNAAPYQTIYTSISRPNANCVCVTFDTPPANGIEYKVIVIN